MIWRVRAVFHWFMCLAGRHEWQPCGCSTWHNPWAPEDEAICPGSICAWCLTHSLIVEA